MAKIMDPILPILTVLGFWAIFGGSLGGPGSTGLHKKEDGTEDASRSS